MRSFVRYLTCLSIVLLALPSMVAAQANRGTAGNPKLTQGFSVVLVLGELKGDTAISNDVPVGARRALADMKDFLPYRSYKLLDTTWILSNNTGRASSSLRGLDAVDYEVTVIASVSDKGADTLEPVLYVTFSLKDPGTNRLVPGAAQEVRGLEGELTALRRKYGQQHPDALKKEGELVAARSRLRREERIILDTSFTMSGGETVVVGTSRVQGDSALIALLTAVPRSSGK